MLCRVTERRPLDVRSLRHGGYSTVMETVFGFIQSLCAPVFIYQKSSFCIWGYCYFLYEVLESVCHEFHEEAGTETTSTTLRETSSPLLRRIEG